MRECSSSQPRIFLSVKDDKIIHVHTWKSWLNKDHCHFTGESAGIVSERFYIFDFPNCFLRNISHVNTPSRAQLVRQNLCRRAAKLMEINSDLSVPIPIALCARRWENSATQSLMHPSNTRTYLKGGSQNFCSSWVWNRFCSGDSSPWLI